MGSNIEVIKKATENLEALRKEMERCENPVVKTQLEMIAKAMEEELREYFEDVLVDIFSDERTKGKAQKLVMENPAILTDLGGFFEKLFDDANSLEIPEGILDIINNPNRSSDTAIEYNPLMTKAMTAAAKENKTQVVSFSSKEGRSSRTMTLKQGHLSVYDSFVLNLAIREYRLGNVTSKDEVVFMLDDICRAMTGKKGTPSQKQREDARKALETIRNTLFQFITTDDLAAILGVEVAEIADRLEGFKGIRNNEIKLHETHLIDKLDVLTNFKRRGKQTTVVVLTFGGILKSLLDYFPWYQEVETEINNIQYEKNGVLEDMPVTKDRLALQHYIHRKVFAKIRTNISGGRYSNKICYRDIFADCEIDVTRNEQKKRRIEQVKQIFEDLKRKGYIVSFSEYDNKTETRAGIKYTTPKFEHEEIEE